MANSIKKLKVNFTSNSEEIDSLVSDALITQLMVTITRVGLRTDRLNNNDAIIRKEKEHDSKEG